ncbi:MAG: 2-oxoacid:ferredoxin oxidoreductase subunit beta [Elusimicrobia bacterium]|nr:2-oxoacid:ferredoxin oxidoreductase subunit beta [Elusimicrobiota bacterium]
MANVNTHVQSVADIKSKVNPVWCPGCGDFGVLSAIYRACLIMDLDLKNTVIVSGIGCSGRLPIFTKCYGFHGVHGRVLPTATGIKLANPNLEVIAVGGDGDGLAIGGGHFPHAARRNVDMTYIMMDNSTYGLTKGQGSPTTSPDFHLKALPYGVQEENLNPVALSLAYDVSFVARAFSGAIDQMTDLFVKAIKHKGFSFVHSISPCTVFNDTYKYYRERIVNIPEEHDVHNKKSALDLWQIKGKVYLGVFFESGREDLGTTLKNLSQSVQNKSGKGSIDKLFDQFS